MADGTSTLECYSYHRYYEYYCSSGSGVGPQVRIPPWRDFEILNYLPKLETDQLRLFRLPVHGKYGINSNFSTI